MYIQYIYNIYIKLLFKTFKKTYFHSSDSLSKLLHIKIFSNYIYKDRIIIFSVLTKLNSFISITFYLNKNIQRKRERKRERERHIYVVGIGRFL